MSKISQAEVQKNEMCVAWFCIDFRRSTRECDTKHVFSQLIIIVVSIVQESIFSEKS